MRVLRGQSYFALMSPRGINIYTKDELKT